MFVSSKVEEQLLLSPVSPPPSLPLHLPSPLLLLFCTLFHMTVLQFFLFPLLHSRNTFSWYSRNSIELSSGHNQKTEKEQMVKTSQMKYIKAGIDAKLLIL